MFAFFYRLADTNFCVSHQPLLSGSGWLSVADSNYRAPNSGFCPRGRNRSYSSPAPFRLNSRFANSTLLA
jgi:hypothetical protein